MSFKLTISTILILFLSFPVNANSGDRQGSPGSLHFSSEDSTAHKSLDFDPKAELDKCLVYLEAMLDIPQSLNGRFRELVRSCWHSTSLHLTFDEKIGTMLRIAQIYYSKTNHPISGESIFHDYNEIVSKIVQGIRQALDASDFKTAISLYQTLYRITMQNLSANAATASFDKVNGLFIRYILNHPVDSENVQKLADSSFPGTFLGSYHRLYRAYGYANSFRPNSKATEYFVANLMGGTEIYANKSTDVVLSDLMQFDEVFAQLKIDWPNMREMIRSRYIEGYYYYRLDQGQALSDLERKEMIEALGDSYPHSRGFKSQLLLECGENVCKAMQK